MGKEFELKYKADGETLAEIREKFEGFTSITMETAYFDTPGRELTARNWMLRRRLENGISVCTMKTPPVNGERGEWETVCPVLTAAIPELCKQGAPEELLALTADGIEEVCAARFTRLAATLTLPECTLELALDRGRFLGGGKEQPFAEVEVELKDGSRAAAERFAEGLAREFGLKPEPKSKAQRAMALL